MFLAVAFLGSLTACASSPKPSLWPELEYFEALNRAAPPRDPQLLFLLMGQYANANMQLEGIDFFSARLKVRSG